MILIFPDIAVDGSLHTAILVGLLVTWALHERLGWVFAGFVVAGYLAALALVAPAALFVILLESVITYGLVRLLTDGLPALGVYPPVFGRERFLLFVLVALPVRLLCTGVAMPRLSAWLAAYGASGADVGPGLLGVGIVLVPLVANTFYKPGLARGLMQISVTSGLTWLVIGPLLGRYTNLGFAAFSETLDALSLGPLPPSRSVLLLVVTAFTAAHNNARFGWDFGGILVPALLAMLALDPARLVATLGEIVVLYLAYKGLLLLPWVRGLDLGGPRRIVSVYLLSWVLHQGVAWATLLLDLPVPVGDVFGFGYLLSSLVVTRCHAAKSLLRPLVPLVFTAAEGVVLAGAAAAILTRLGPDAEAPGASWQPDPTRSLAGAVVEIAARASPREPGAEVGPGLAWAAEGSSAVRVDGCWLTRAPRAWRLQCPGDGPVLVVAWPLADPDSAWLAGWVARQVQPAGIVIAAADPASPVEGRASADLLHQAMVEARAMAGSAPIVVVGALPADEPAAAALWTRGPGAAAALLAAIPGLSIATGEPPVGREAQWGALQQGEGLLLLSPSAIGPGTVGGDGWPSGDLGLLVEHVVPAVMRLSGQGRPADGALRWLAGLAGAQLEVGTGPAGVVITLSVRDGHGSTDRLILRPEGEPWLVATEAAGRWPGADPVTAWYGEALGARVTWIAAPEPRSGRRHAAADMSTVLERAARALIPADAGAELSVLVVGAAPEEHGVAWLRVDDQAELAALVAASTPWPGLQVMSAGSTSWAPPMPELSRRQRALGRTVSVLDLPRALLREADPQDRARRVAWQAALGIPRAVAPGPLVAGEDHPEVLTALRRHADLPTASTLREVGDWAVSVAERGPRLLVVARRGRSVCTAVAGGGGVSSPSWSGCGDLP